MTDIDRNHLDTITKHAIQGHGLHYASGRMSAPSLWVRPSTVDLAGSIVIAGDNPDTFEQADGSAPWQGWECCGTVPVCTPNQLGNWLREKLRRLPVLPILPLA